MTRIVVVPKVALALACGALSLACTAKEERVEQDFKFDGTCINCHAGLSGGQAHPTFKLRCVDCHGGNDQVDIVPEDAFENEEVFRDPNLIAASHVQFKDPGLARFFFANGQDDDDDGQVDEVIQFDDINNPTQVIDFGEIAELGLQGEGVGQFLDTEYNRDLNYTRWLNPGDLRVATMSCGGGSRVAGETGSGCHQSVVDSMRRSIMTNQSAVISGAYYGNESWRAEFQQDRDDIARAADPRQGTYGYPLAYDLADACIVQPEEDNEPGGRAQPVFDSTCIEAAVELANLDANAEANALGNVGLPTFESVQGAIVGSVEGTEPGATLEHKGVFAGSSRFEGWGGKPVQNVQAILAELEPVLDLELLGLPDPVDNVLRGFRAYYPLNYPGSTINQNFTFGESINPNVQNIQTQNPFGRGHSAGCTACHMAYNYDGSRDAQNVLVQDEDGNSVFKEVVDPTTKHREFDPATQDIVEVDGQDRLIGITVNAAERDVDEDGDIEIAEGSPDREQQRFYSSKHQLNSRITSQQCGLCHAFVTRIDLAYQGLSEDEQRDALARIDNKGGVVFDRTIQFTTPKGTNVAIHDSLVREEFENGVFQRLVVPNAVNRDGLNLVEEAKQRDAELAAQGLIPGNGGCAADTFTEDCNNNGELDTELVLQQVDPEGNPIGSAITINEDFNGDGVLDLIDHAPREVSLDGRQMRYIYGGANGATRLMDIHFERGMHCIDCHMIQDAHGDGNIYSTNWEQIEIECEDCHGTVEAPTDFITTGPNGGNDLRLAEDHDGRPFFEEKDGKVLQRSRVTPGLAWEIPQTVDIIDEGSKFFNPEAVPAHNGNHLPANGIDTSVFEGAPGQSLLQQAKLECYSCHMSWVINCMGCHYAVNGNVGNRTAVDADGNLVAVAGENEVWYNNKNQDALTNFQLLTFMRSPFVLGYNATADEQRVGPFRSSMELQVSITDDQGFSIFDNITFTTHQAIDGNSGRSNVATSGAALNQTMPHTVRPFETRGCEQCHSLVDDDGAIRNDHVVAETFGIGLGRYSHIGDWAFLVGGGGLELFEYKDENELIPNNRFPGIIVDPNDRVNALVDAAAFPAGADATDAVFIRNFNPEPAAAGGTELPTLTDIVAVTFNEGNDGRLALIDVTARGALGNPLLPRIELVNLDGAPASAVAHIAPDVSDPFVYIAHGANGLTTVKVDANGVAAAANFADTAVVSTVAVPGGNELTEVVLAGDVLYAGTAQGTIEVFDLANPAQPVHRNSVALGTGAVNGLAIGGFFLYGATVDGLVILELTNEQRLIDLENPRLPEGASEILAVAGINVSELFYSEGHVYLAAGAQVLDVDVTTPAKPGAPVDLVQLIAPGEVVDAVDVVVSKLPVQTWLLVAEANGDLVGLKLDNTQSIREICFPDPAAANCGVNMDFRDPTVMGRDPSFIPGQNAFDPNDPSGEPFFRIASVDGNVVSGRRLARGSQWEKINTHTGRRYRDSFMPGSGTLSLEVMRKMYGYLICEVPDTEDINGNGLGSLGEANGDFLATGVCVPFAEDPGEGSVGALRANVEGQSLRAPESDDICLPREGADMCLAAESTWAPETAPEPASFDDREVAGL